MKLVVGFVTYEESSLKYLEHFLPSLKNALLFLADTDYQIAVFDNSSSEDNRNRLALELFHHQHAWPFRYNTRGQNLGFGAAYNILITQARDLEAKYFLMINPDTLLEQDSIKNLIENLDKDSAFSAASPKILRWDFKSLKRTKQIDSCGLQKKPGLIFYDLGQGEQDSAQYDRDVDIIGPSGAAALFRLDILEKLRDKHGYFDERFYMYKEDCDLAYRLKLANFKTIFVPEAVIYHDRSMAFYGSSKLDFWRNRRSFSRITRAWSFRNQHLLFFKYFCLENTSSRLLIVKQVLMLLFFSLILEQFNLKEYKSIIKLLKS